MITLMAAALATAQPAPATQAPAGQPAGHAAGHAGHNPAQHARDCPCCDHGGSARDRDCCDESRQQHRGHDTRR
jgi:hypothetical protein